MAEVYRPNSSGHNGYGRDKGMKLTFHNRVSSHVDKRSYGDGGSKLQIRLAGSRFGSAKVITPRQLGAIPFVCDPSTAVLVLVTSWLLRIVILSSQWV